VHATPIQYWPGARAEKPLAANVKLIGTVISPSPKPGAWARIRTPVGDRRGDENAGAFGLPAGVHVIDATSVERGTM
jgi:hypothetical protein